MEQMVPHEPFWSLSEPLEEREVLELVCAENLQYFQWFIVAQVLDEVTCTTVSSRKGRFLRSWSFPTHVLRHNAHISCGVVEGPCVTLSAKDGYTRSPSDEERPLISVRVPMHLTQSSRLDIEVPGRDLQDHQ